MIRKHGIDIHMFSEAADDIYTIVDFEDGVRLGHIKI